MQYDVQYQKSKYKKMNCMNHKAVTFNISKYYYEISKNAKQTILVKIVTKNLFGQSKSKQLLHEY